MRNLVLAVEMTALYTGFSDYVLDRWGNI